MADNFLQLDNKTTVILFGPQHLTSNASPHLGSLASSVNSPAKNLRVIIDTQLQFDKHIIHAVSSHFKTLKSSAPLTWRKIGMPVYPLL